MFIKKMKRDDFEDFISNKLYIDKKVIGARRAVYKDNSNTYSAIFFTKNYMARSFTFSDFKVSTDIPYIDEEKLSFMWREFMHEKFGDEYKQSYEESLKKENSSEIIK